MPDLPSFAEKLISQMPALQLLMALGYEYLTPEQALRLRRGKAGQVVLEGVLGPSYASTTRSPTRAAPTPSARPTSARPSAG